MGALFYQEKTPKPQAVLNPEGGGVGDNYIHKIWHIGVYSPFIFSIVEGGMQLNVFFFNITGAFQYHIEEGEYPNEVQLQK